MDNFTFSLEKGHICGLIGPNGAGKTTIMKMMAGIAAPEEGSMIFFDGKESLDEAWHKMSFMIESPIIDLGMTAYENMQYVCYVRGITDQCKMTSMLEYVGLSHAGKKEVRKYSLGMKQRLGIGMALLSSPEILVLDEPVNGLDPEGIVEIRNLLRNLAREKNVTILISSHLLSELAELCTDFTLIHHGRLIESFNQEELKVRCQNHISIQSNDLTQTVAILKEQLSIENYEIMDGEELHLYEYVDDIGLVSKTITDHHLILTKLVIEGESLEQYYLSKVGEENA